MSVCGYFIYIMLDLVVLGLEVLDIDHLVQLVVVGYYFVSIVVDVPNFLIISIIVPKNKKKGE